MNASYPHPSTMLTKIKEQQKAIQLRKQGFSYSEILEVLPVAKSSISGWVNHLKLTSKQRQRLMVKAQGAGGQARKKQRLQKQLELAQEVKKEIADLFKNPFFTLGLALYWAEGNKEKPWRLGQRAGFSNSDERMILLMREWFKEFFRLKSEDFSYALHIHATANIQEAKEKWSEALNITSENLRITLKRHVIKMRYNNPNYKGLIQMHIRKSTWMLRRIDLWIKHAAQFFLK